MPKGIDSTLYLHMIYWALVAVWVVLSAYFALASPATLSQSGAYITPRIPTEFQSCLRSAPSSSPACWRFQAAVAQRPMTFSTSSRRETSVAR
jgi:hypothetical protein